MIEIIYTTFTLQLFAEKVNKTTDTAATTGNDLSAENKTYYDLRLIDVAGPELVHDQFAQVRNIPANGGKKIEFRRFSPLPKALVPLTEGVTPDGNSLDVSKIEAEIEQYGDFVVQTDLLEMTAIDDTVVQALNVLGRQAGETLDTVTRNKLQSGSYVQYAHKLVEGVETEVTSRSQLDKTAQLTVDEVEQAVNWLKNNNAPKINGYFAAIVHPDTVYTLRRDPEWRKPHEYCDPGALYEGEIGMIAGCRFVESTEAKVYRGADLSAVSRTLAVNNVGGYSGASVIAFDGGGTIEADALIGRYVIINGTKAYVGDNDATTLTLYTDSQMGTAASITCDDNAVIYPGEGGAEGLSVYGSLFMGDGAYGTTALANGGLETIVKQLGQGEDRLNQRSSVGWKATKTAEILVDAYIIRVESCSARYSDKRAEN